MMRYFKGHLLLLVMLGFIFTYPEIGLATETSSSALPDLRVQSVTFDQTGRLPVITIVNDGTAAVSWTGSIGPHIQAEWYNAQGVRAFERLRGAIRALAPGESQVFDYRASVNRIPEGSTRVRVVVDADIQAGEAHITESNENNNVWEGDVPSAAVSPILPDLHVNPIVRLPDTPTDGGMFYLSVGVENLGTGVAGASTLSARLDLGNNGAHIGADPYGVFDETLPALSIPSIAAGARAGGSSATFGWNWSAWPEWDRFTSRSAWNSGGPHRIVVCADSTSVVAESDENNNCSVVVILSNSAATPARDTVRPSAPLNVRRTSEPTDTTPTFLWDPATDNVAISHYLVNVLSMGGGDIGIPRSNVGNTTTYTVPDAYAFTPGTSYTLWISTYDTSGNYAADLGYLLFTIQSVRVPDTTPPPIITETLPDLVVESVGFEPGWNYPNIVMGNRGTAESSPVSRGQQAQLEWLNSSNVRVGDAVSQGMVSILPGQRMPMAFDTARPPVGATRLRMTVDVGNVIRESNEGNNVWTGDIMLPDLIIQSVTFDSISRAPIVTVRNQGNAPALSQFPPATPRVLYQWLNAAGGVLGMGTELAIPSGELAVNRTYTLSGGALVPPDGAVRLRVTVDPVNLMPELVGELNEINNVWEGLVPERGQPLPPTPASNNSTLLVERRFVGQYNNTKYNLIAVDPEGVKYILVNKVGGNSIFGGEPPCLTRVESGTVTLEPSDFPLSVRMTDCNTPGQVSTFQVSMPVLPLEVQESREAVVQGERPQQIPTPSPPVPQRIELLPEQKVELQRKTAEERRVQIEKIKEGSPMFLLGVSKFVEEKQIIRDMVKEQFADQKIDIITQTLLSILSTDKKQIVEDSMKAFIAYGAPTKAEVLEKPIEKLGAGERAGVVNSFKEAFGKLPETNKDWEDVMKIAIGRFPSQTSASREKESEEIFKKIYLRVPARTQSNDNACVTIIAYGLRPDKRNLNSEKVSIQTFKQIFKKAPITASEWDTVRCIGYSGAKR